MKATQKETREDLLQCAIAQLENIILLDCFLEAMNQNEKNPAASEILQGILDRLWSYIDGHADEVKYLSACLTGRKSIPPA